METWPVLHASHPNGKAESGWAACETEREFEDYHLRFEYRWAGATGKHIASLRYHCTGPVGSKGTHGMELHVQTVGSYLRFNDFLRVDRGEVRGNGVEAVEPAGRVIPARDAKEAPFGKWNRAALVCVGDTAVHVLNDVVVLALAKSRKVTETGDVPLTRGRVRFQSKEGDIFFRKIEVRKVTEVPPEYRRAAAEAVPAAPPKP